MLVPKHSWRGIQLFLAISQDFPNLILKLVFPMIRKCINRTILQVGNRQKCCESGSFNKLFQSFIFEKCFQNVIYKAHRSTWFLVAFLISGLPLQKGKKTPIIMKLYRGGMSHWKECWGWNCCLQYNKDTWPGDILPISGYTYIIPTYKPHYQTTNYFKTSLPKVFSMYCD